MVLYKIVCQRAFHDAENVYNFVVGSFVKRTPDLLSSIQTSSKFKVYIFAKNLHHFYSFGHRMLVSSTVQSKPGVKHVKQIKILLQKQTGYTLADAYPESLETAVLVLRHIDNIMLNGILLINRLRHTGTCAIRFCALTFISGFYVCTYVNDALTYVIDASVFLI